jgi:hypothetical protein
LGFEGFWVNVGVGGTLCWIERKGGWNYDDGLWRGIRLMEMVGIKLIEVMGSEGKARKFY